MNKANILRIVQVFSLGFVCVLMACELGPEKVGYFDPRVRQLLAAAEKVDRAALGFTAISTNARITLELPNRGGAYDAMLHIYDPTNNSSRTIAFRKTADGYRWINEQESHEGPGWRQTVDGTFREKLLIEFQTERLNGIPTNQIVIQHDEAGTNYHRRELTLPEAQALLAKWKTAPVESQPPDLPGLGFDPAPLMFVLFMLAGLVFAACLALALVSITLVITSMLLIGGIISSSVAIGVLRRSVAGGFRALFLQLGAVFGIVSGVGVTAMVTALQKTAWNSSLRWIMGTAVGLVFGLCAAWLFNKAWTLLAKFLTNRVGSSASIRIEKRIT